MLGEDVDLGLLLQCSKDQRVWVEGLGDQGVLSLQQWCLAWSSRAGWLEVGGGVFLPLPEICPSESQGTRYSGPS